MADHEYIQYNLESLGLITYRDPKKVPEFLSGKLNGPRYEIGIRTREEPAGEAGKKDYTTFTCPRSRDPAFDQFLRAFVEAIAFWEIVDVYAPSPANAFDKLINDFLMQHTGKTYEQYRREAHVYQIDQNDYGKVARKSLRGKLFNYRSKLYLSALAAVTAKGVELEKILSQVHDAIIPPIKKEREEPTFEYICKFLHKFNRIKRYIK